MRTSDLWAPFDAHFLDVMSFDSSHRIVVSAIPSALHFHPCNISCRLNFTHCVVVSRLILLCNSFHKPCPIIPRMASHFRGWCSVCSPNDMSLSLGWWSAQCWDSILGNKSLIENVHVWCALQLFWVSVRILRSTSPLRLLLYELASAAISWAPSPAAANSLLMLTILEFPTQQGSALAQLTSVAATEREYPASWPAPNGPSLLARKILGYSVSPLMIRTTTEPSLDNKPSSYLGRTAYPL